MGIKERREIEIAEMKKKIITAATELIEQEGYENLSIRKIAAKIEYSPTTIYLYYKDKAEIIIDMSDELYYRTECDFTDFLTHNSELPIDTQIHSILKLFIKSLCSEPEMAKAVMYSGSNIIFTNENERPQNSGLDKLDLLFAEGIAQKALSPTIANASWMIISALIGFVMNSLENKLYMLEEFDQLVNTFADIMMGGIRL